MNEGKPPGINSDALNGIDTDLENNDNVNNGDNSENHELLLQQLIHRWIQI